MEHPRVITVSLPADEVEFLDELVECGASASRSAAVGAAVRHFRTSLLGAAYEAASRENQESEELAP